jgi:hypothetical protein
MTVSEVEELEVNDIDQPPLEIRNMIQHAMDNEYSQANNIFKDMMTIKLNDLLDQEQVRIADAIYNGVEDNAEENDPDEDQLELDLEAEGELESDEEDDEEDEEDENDQ